MIKMTTDMDLLRTDFYMNVLKGIPLDPRELLCVLFSKEESGDANRNNQNDSSSNNDDNINDTSNSPSNQNCDNDASNTADNSNIQSPAPEVKEIIDTNVPAVQSVEEGVTEGHSYISDFEGSGTVAIAVSGTCSPETKLELEIMTTCVEDAIEDSEKEEVRGVRASNSFRSMDSSVQSDVENYFRDSYFADRIYTDLKNASAVVQEEDRLQAALDTEKIDLKRRKVFIPLLKLRPAKRD